jgi:hypothetical protein
MHAIPSIRRVVLGTTLVLLLLFDAGVIYDTLELLWIGELFSPVGGEVTALVFGLMLVRIPVMLILLWLTVVAWNAIQR